MKIKCAIFDFDGTLFDSMSVWENVGERYLRSLRKEPAPALREALRPLSLYQAAVYMKKSYSLSLSEAEIEAGVNGLIRQFYLEEALPKPGVPGFLKRMKEAGISMCIATATDRSLIEAALKRCGLAHYFDAVFTCGEVGHGKDEPVIFRTAMEHSGADRSCTVVFEDALHALATAKEDGFYVIGVFDDSEKRQAEIRGLADCYLTDFEHTEDFWKFASA